MIKTHEKVTNGKTIELRIQFSDMLDEKEAAIGNAAAFMFRKIQDALDSRSERISDTSSASASSAFAKD